MSIADAADHGWWASALCAQTDPESFHPDRGGSTLPAKQLCQRCEVRTPCLAEAMRYEGLGHVRDGVLGGLSPNERTKLAGTGWALGDDAPLIQMHSRVALDTGDCPHCGKPCQSVLMHIACVHPGAQEIRRMITLGQRCIECAVPMVAQKQPCPEGHRQHIALGLCRTCYSRARAAKLPRGRWRYRIPAFSGAREVDAIAVERLLDGSIARAACSEMRTAIGYLDAQGHSARQIAERLGCTVRTVQRARAARRSAAA